MFRLERGISIDTEQKRATSRCMSIVLDTYGAFDRYEPFTERVLSKHSGDALCLVEHTPKHSRARMGARFVNPVELDIRHVLDWLSECESRHPRTCQPTWNENLMQTFLIDVKARRIVGYPSKKCDYIALSYVWGGVDHSIPVVGKAGGSLSMALPATIEDAICLVNALGKQYLWVDSICINQMDQAEKHKQVGLMSGIYQGAYMTIIAMSGTSANAGMARVGHPPIVQYQAQFSTKSGTIVSIGPTLGYLASDMPWAKRAWTFQEAILSQRCLYLTDFQAYFECNAMQCCESLDISQSCVSFEDRRLSVSQDPQEYTNNKIGHVVKLAGPGELRNPCVPRLIMDNVDRLRLYGFLVEQYKKRAMTFESDALNALAGILQAMEGSFFPSGFVLGLPVSALHCALLWEKVDADLGKPNQDFPSWTWASWSGPVRMAHIGLLYQEVDKLKKGHLGQNLTVWRRGPTGIMNVFAQSSDDRFEFVSQDESYKWGDLPLKNAQSVGSLYGISLNDAERVLCVKCYQLSFEFDHARPTSRPISSGVDSYTTDTYGEDIVFNVSDGSKFFKSPPYTKEERRYLVIAETDHHGGPPRKQYHLLGIEQVDRLLWRRVDVLRISIYLHRLDVLYALRPCRTRILLV